MAVCSLATSIDMTCDKARRVGGLKEKIWLVSDMTSFAVTIDGSGYVTGLTFDTYAGLVDITGIKNSHSAGSELVVSGEGGNKFFSQTVAVKCMATAPTEVGAIEDLLGWNGAIIYQTRNREFFIAGAYNGMDLTAGTQNTGAVSGSDISDILTFSGEEQYLRLQVLDTDYDTTLALLESYEI